MSQEGKTTIAEVNETDRQTMTQFLETMFARPGDHSVEINLIADVMAGLALGSRNDSFDLMKKAIQQSS
jgi:hypothetical protein